MMIFTDSYSSPIGEMTLASDGEFLTGLWFDGQRFDREGLEKDAEAGGAKKIFETTKNWLDIYFEGKDPGFLPPLKLTGSDFRKLVCEIMLTIPFGKTMSYGDIAKKAAKSLGKEKMSAQAVGGAVGHNPISIIVPCHRVMGSDGSLTGYGGGLERKIFLLGNEGIGPDEKGHYIPKE